MTERQASAMSRDPRVRFVEEDGAVVTSGSVTTTNWGVDRVDNRVSPRLDNSYTFCTTGKGVRAYVVDSGIVGSHDQFANPEPITGGSRVPLGYDYNYVVYPSQGNKSNNPCTTAQRTATNFGGSHGTAVASALGGRTMGLASEAVLVPVRVLQCDGGFGYDPISRVVAGLDWIPTDPGYTAYVPVPGTSPTSYRFPGRVVNMSFHIVADAGTPVGEHSVELAVQRLIDIGVTVVNAVGNENEPVGLRVPSRYPPVISVGGSMGHLSTMADARWTGGPTDNPGSNYGPEVDLFAPADRVLVAHWNTPTATRDPNDTRWSSGTSFSAPYVAGAAARLLQFYPTENNAQIATRLINDATNGTHGLAMSNLLGSPNLLLFTYTHCKMRACCS